MVYLILLIPFLLFANPQGAQVVKGNVHIETMPLQTNITASDGSVIHWQDFSIQEIEVTKFVQPSPSSVVVNKVVGNNLSKIHGQLEANGKVYLINPQGIIVGKDGVVQTNGFIASTLELQDPTFNEYNTLFFEGNTQASIQNFGTIEAKDGSIYLLAHSVQNEGKIFTERGKASIICSDNVYLRPDKHQRVYIKLNEKSTGTLVNKGLIKGNKVELQGCVNPFVHAIKQHGQIEAFSLTHEKGEIYLKAHRGKTELAGSCVNEGGKTHIATKSLTLTKQSVIEDRKRGDIVFDIEGKSFLHEGTISTKGGTIQIRAPKGNLFHKGLLRTNADIAGSIYIKAQSVFNDGKIFAKGNQKGGKISIKADRQIIETVHGNLCSTAKVYGGDILMQTLQGGKIFSSANHDSSAYTPGSIFLDSSEILVPAAKFVAKGLSQKGKIIIGNKNKECQILENPFTSLKAKTIEKNALIQSSAAKLTTGSEFIEIADPSSTGSEFGKSIAVLHNGNFVVTKPKDSTNNADAGAFFLFDGQTTALISATFGYEASGQIGFSEQPESILAQNIGNNFLVLSDKSSISGVLNGGAATWGSGATGGPAFVTTTNSLYGEIANDYVGSSAIALENGNFVVLSPQWQHPLGQDEAGSATFIYGNNGHVVYDNTLGAAVSTMNSLYGYYANSRVGFDAKALKNGHYVVISPDWSPLIGYSSYGAATWVNGYNGIVAGAASPGQRVETTNSLYGPLENSYIASAGVEALNNGNYVVCSPNCGEYGQQYGTATWMRGSVSYAGLDGLSNGPGVSVTTLNSLYGREPGTQIAKSGAVGSKISSNYLILSPEFNEFDDSAGAATWFDGNSGFASGAIQVGGFITTLNSLYGLSYGDAVGHSAIALEQGGFAVFNPGWNGVSTYAYKGAVTRLDDLGFTYMATSFTGASVTTLNSLYGTNQNDQVGIGGGKALLNGNYVVLSPYWNGVTYSGGAATLVRKNGKPLLENTVGSSVKAQNSLYGSNLYDFVGYDGVAALDNGNYLVLSSYWNGTAQAAGAVTWVNGANGQVFNTTIVGQPVSTTNSLYGVFANDRVGYSHSGTLTTVANTFAIISEDVDQEFTSQGAVTSGDGAVGISGPVSLQNSFFGSSENAGKAMFALDNGPNFINNPIIISFPNDGTGRLFVNKLGMTNQVPFFSE